MTTIAASPLTDALQTLVDARLDTIDRMLLGRVNRHDRLAIVREVETQIFDLLQGRDTESLDRDDVIAVLARLDPPEAYLPDEDSPAEGPRHAIRPATARTLAIPSGLAKPAGVLGIISPIFVFLAYPIGLGLNSEILLLLMMLVGLLSGVLAIVFASMAKLRGAWAITGLVMGIVSLTSCFAVAAFIMLH